MLWIYTKKPRKENAKNHKKKRKKDKKSKKKGLGMLVEKLQGVNLAGWLVLEPWVTPSLFASSGTFDELSLAHTLGEEKYEKLVAHHRDTFITEEDFAQIAARGFNAVRLPVAWSILGEEGPRPGTRLGAIEKVDQALDWAQKYNLQVLLVMGTTPSGTGDQSDQERFLDPTGIFRAPALEVLETLAKRYAHHKALFGIEPLDEPIAQRWVGFSVQPGVPLYMLKNFYRDAYEVIRKHCSRTKAVVLSAAGVPGSWRHFMSQDHYASIYLDLHLYHYDEQNTDYASTTIRKIARQSKKSIDKASRSKIPILVGEWSAALPAQMASPTLEGRIAQERIFAAAQIACFKKTDGWFFQTWKTESKLSAWDARSTLSSFENDALVS